MPMCQNRIKYAGRNGLQDVGSRSRMYPRSSTRFPRRAAGKLSLCTNGVTTKPAEWPDDYDPFKHGEEFGNDLDGSPRQSDEDDPYGEKPQTPNGKGRSCPKEPLPSQPYGGNGGSTQVTPEPRQQAECCIADPIMLPYSSVYYPDGPWGPRIQICPYVPLYWCLNTCP